MPIHHAINATVFNGSITFNASKTGDISFGYTFNLAPIVQITLSDQSASSPAYKINASTTGVTIKFQNNYTGTVDWVAIRR